MVFLDYKLISIGILVYDWVVIIKVLVDFISIYDDFYYFGYIFLLIVKENGILVCNGYIEVVVDLVELVGEFGVGYICEIFDVDGYMVWCLVLEKMVEELWLLILIVKEL